MDDFKIGDRVVVTDTDYDTDADENLSNGSKGVVVHVSESGRCVSVRMDEGERRDAAGNGWAFSPNQIAKEPQP